MNSIIFDAIAIEDLTQWSKSEPRLVKKRFLNWSLTFESTLLRVSVNRKD